MLIPKPIIPFFLLSEEFTNKYFISAEKPIKFIKYPAASDARLFSEKGIPVIMTRGAGGGQHSKNEWASLPDLVKSYKILEKFVKEIRSIKKDVTILPISCTTGKGIDKWYRWLKIMVKRKRGGGA